MGSLALSIVELQLRDDDGNLYDFIPSLVGNGIFLAIFSLLLVCQVFLAVYAKQWWFGTCYVCGLILEVLGYAARVKGHFDQEGMSLYILQSIGLTISPCFFMAGIYYIFGQVATIYGSQYSRLRPMQYSAFFITFDVIAVLVQGAGGGIASGAGDNASTQSTGTWVMVGGLIVQVFSMTVFLFFWFDFLHSLRRAKKYGSEREIFEEKYYEIRHSKLFKPFLVFYTSATFFIYIRSIYRVVELAQGWTGYLITNEIYVFMLDGMLIAIATAILTVMHPGIAFGKDANIVVRTKKSKKNDDTEDDYELKDENGRAESNELYEEPNVAYQLDKNSSTERSVV